MNKYLINGLAILLAFLIVVGGFASLLVAMTKDYSWNDWFKMIGAGGLGLLPLLLSAYNVYSYKKWVTGVRGFGIYCRAGAACGALNGIVLWALFPMPSLGGFYDIFYFGLIIFLSGAMGGFIACAHCYLLRDLISHKFFIANGNG